MQIFYLDDETDLLDMFSETFSSDLVTIKTFTDPVSLVEECSTNPPDLVIIDYRLPGTRGDIIAERINSKIPKCLITGDLQIVTEYPFYKIFQKPFENEKIQSAIFEFLSKKN